MLTRTYHRVLTWLAARAGMHLFSSNAIKGLQERAYYDGWHDAEQRLEAVAAGKAKYA